MDPNNLAVNSVISSYLTFSAVEDDRLLAALRSTLEKMCQDESPFHDDVRRRILMNLSSISFWYRMGVHDERLGRV